MDAVEKTLGVLIQIGVDLGIPFDKVPETKFDLAYLQCCLQWVIFFVSVFCGTMNSLMRSSMGVIK